MNDVVAPLFQVRNVSKAFGPKVLLKDASLDVYPGETLAIIGESGSGKSVFLKMLIGLVEVDEGEILFKGERIGDMGPEALQKLHRQIGYVFQADALFDSMPIVENVGYAMREHTNASDEDIRARAKTCMDMVGLKQHVLDLYPASLSGGMRKRAALARAIAIEPEVILYDEPTQGLDPQNITRIAEMIEALQRDLKVTSVVVTHDLRTAFGVSNRIVMLHDQRFQYEGTPEEMMNSTEVPVREFIDEAMDELRELFEQGALGSDIEVVPQPSP
jgi:phospholipid/cholesterol/gamma-HCH transport system ATP-binding protein